MRGSIIENEDHGMHLTTQRFGNDLLLHEGLEIDKAFALPTRSVDLAIGDRESGKQMPGSTTMIARVACLDERGEEVTHPGVPGWKFSHPD